MIVKICCPQNLFIYYTLKNIRKQYKINKLKIIALTWNDEFKLPDGFYSVLDIQDYIEYIIKKYETLTTVPPIHARITNAWTNQLFASTVKLIDKTGEKVQSLEVAEVVLVQCNLTDNQCQKKSEALYTFTQNKSCACLLNVEPSNLVFLKTCNTVFDETIITFTD